MVATRVCVYTYYVRRCLCCWCERVLKQLNGCSALSEVHGYSSAASYIPTYILCTCTLLMRPRTRMLMVRTHVLSHGHTNHCTSSSSSISSSSTAVTTTTHSLLVCHCDMHSCCSRAHEPMCGVNMYVTVTGRRHARSAVVSYRSTGFNRQRASIHCRHYLALIMH